MEYRTERITFRVTSTELKTIKKKLEETNCTMSEFVRSAVLDKDIIETKELTIIVKEIIEIKRYINQLKSMANRGLIKYPQMDNEDKKLDEITQILKKLLE
ncbi:MAG: plasmid mobilization protein [Tissierellaceae bacterium]|jgi:uncharacterized protein (DUF1778 family)